MSKLTVAVCGATGAVGREMLNTLHQRAFPATEVLAFASSRSAGSKVEFGDQELTVRELKEDSFEGARLAVWSWTIPLPGVWTIAAPWSCRK